MPATFDLILTGGTVVNQDGKGVRDVGVRDGRIAAVGDLGRASAGETIDCAGLHVLPGVVDSQVHFREPGMEHKEDLEAGSRAAVLGGVTAVFEMPNTKPLTTSEAALADKVRRATGRMHCDFAFWVGGTRDNARDLGELERLPGAAGIKVFMGSSTGDLLVEDDEGVASILRNTRRRAAFHSEDEFRLRERLGERVEGDALRSGPEAAAGGLERIAVWRHGEHEPALAQHEHHYRPQCTFPTTTDSPRRHPWAPAGRRRGGRMRAVLHRHGRRRDTAVGQPAHA